MNIFKAIRASRILDERDRTHAGIPADLNDQAVIDAELSDPSSTPWQQPPNFVHSRVMNAIAASRHARMRPRALPTWPLGWAAAAAVVLMVAGTPMGRTLWSSLQEAGALFGTSSRVAITPPPIVDADAPSVATLPRSDADDPARREIEALREDTRRAARAIFSDPDDNDGW